MLQARHRTFAALARLLALGAVSALLGCPRAGEQSEDTTLDRPVRRADVRVQRAIDLPPGEVITVDLPRAQLGAEARTVLASAPRTVLRWRERVSLRGDLELELELPEKLARSSWLRIDVWVSVRDPELREQTQGQMRTGGRLSLTAEPVILAEPAAGGRVTVKLPVPAAVRGKTGYLNAVARSLSESPIQRDEVGPFEIGPEARLDFGYGVEAPGWDEGWPPVRFRVSTSGDGEGESETLFDERIDPAANPEQRRWFDASVDLSRFAGRTLGLVFEAEAEAAGGGPVARSFPVVSNPEVVDRAEGGKFRPNVILFSLDTLRSRNVSAYGYRRRTTPALDERVAARGVLVRSVVVPYPFTPPSHVTMLTGLEPCAHGVDGRHGVLAAERPTLAEVLRAAGYKTAAFTEDGYVVAGAGFERGFDRYVEHRSEKKATPGFVSETFGSAREWLATAPPEPFFLFVHTYQVHAPYEPPEEYRSLFAGPGSDAEPVNQPGISKKYADAIADYDREIRYTDDALAGFLDQLESTGLAEDTLVVVTSDHGEGFGEHHQLGHGFSLYDEDILVPLVARGPGLAEPGRVIEQQVGLVDLVPTLLELLDLPVPEGVQGRSFAGLLAGKGSFEERPLVSVAGRGGASVRTRDFKYIEGEVRKKTQTSYYELGSDPLEAKNLARRRPQEVASARELIRAHQERCVRWHDAHPTRERDAHYLENQPGWLINRDEIDETLRALGYAE